MSHTIAAISTGNCISAIGIIRLTGDDCAQIAGKVFTLNNNTPLSEAPDRKLVLGTLRDKEGRTIDSCCAIYCRGPHSYTGEDTVRLPGRTGRRFGSTVHCRCQACPAGRIHQTSISQR